MGNLFTSLLNSSNALGVYAQALQVVQNNVANVNTPGYAKQTQTLEALPFDLTVGSPGGVAAGPVESSRSPFAEQNVRDQQSSLGLYQQQASDLAPVAALFDVTGKSGIGPALNGLFNSFSQLSINPSDTSSRQAVIASATSVAQTIHQTAVGLQTTAQQVTSEAQTTVTAINNLAATIAHLNTQGVHDIRGGTDAGLDAQLTSTLEQLSQYTNFTALQQPGGSITVYIGGQTPLVVGDQVHAIQADASTPQLHILSDSGKDITKQISQGQLAAVVDTQNNKLPSYLVDLNTLASGVAYQVNAALGNGIDQNGAAPVNNLFTYDASNGAAFTLAVNAAVTPDQLAAALPGAPGGNGNALNLAALGSAPALNGSTFTQFYGKLGSRVGTDTAQAQSSTDSQTQLLTQAQTLRSQASGVSLDSEAESLIRFQRSYQATSKLFTVLNELTNTVIGLIQ